jgi:predicted DNA-binding transcriptional regulator AlpA
MTKSTDHAPLSGAASRAARRAPTPPELADVALIDGPRCAAAGCIAISTWYELVRRGEAPQPVLRAPRCTRWRLADVREWLRLWAERGSDPGQRAVLERTVRRATNAAQSRRAAVKAGA